MKSLRFIRGRRIYPLFIAALFSTQAFAWHWSQLDLSLTPGDSLLNNAELTFKLLDETTPRFVYAADSTYYMIYDSDPDPEDINWAIDSSFFDGLEYSDAWYVTGDDSLVRISLAYAEITNDTIFYDLYHYTKNAFIENSEWIEIESMRLHTEYNLYLNYYVESVCMAPFHIDLDNDSNLDWIICYTPSARIERFISEENGWHELQEQYVLPQSYPDGDWYYCKSFGLVYLTDAHDPAILPVYTHAYYNNAGSRSSGRHIVRSIKNLGSEQLSIGAVSGDIQLIGRISSFDIDNDGIEEIISKDMNNLVQWDIEIQPEEVILTKNSILSSPLSGVPVLYFNNRTLSFITEEYFDFFSDPHGGPQTNGTEHYFDNYYKDIESLKWIHSNKINDEAIESYSDDWIIPRLININTNDITTKALFIPYNNLLSITNNEYENRILDSLLNLVNYGIYSMTDYIDLADWSGDGFPDYVYTNNQHLSGLQWTGETWENTENWDIYLGFQRPFICDLDGDGAKDLIASNGRAWINTQQPREVPEFESFDPFENSGITFDGNTFFNVLDLQADGDADILYYNGKILVNDAIETGIRSTMTQPDYFSIVATYPNPFNSFLRVQLELQQPGLVNLSIFNLLGRQVVKQASIRSTDNHLEYYFDAKNLASGNYILQVQSGDWNETKRIVLLR